MRMCNDFLIGFLHKRFEKVLLVSILGFFVANVGCDMGGAMSQASLRRHAIDRGDDEEEEEEAPTAIFGGPSATATPSPPSNSSNSTTRPSPSGPAISSPNNPSPGTPSVDSTPTNSETRSTAVAEPALNPSVANSASSNATGQPPASPLVALSSWRPTQPLEDSERRKRSADNIEKVTAALIEWIENSKMLPRSVIKDSQGRKVLSWRVQILPLLGYNELYSRFNLQEPWDGPANKPLLQYIPQEYVSPDRFDENTNYQLLVNGIALFSEKETKIKVDLSDAPHVLMVAEVDDELAVPWTAPFDYDITEEPIDRGLGHLRDDGFFFGWMTGQVSLWPKPTNIAHLKKAISFEAGDIFPIANYQRYPPISSSGVQRPSMQTASPPQPTTPLPQVSSIAPSPPHGAATIQQAGLPSSEAILAAENKVRSTYMSAYKQARTTVEYKTLATRMHKQLTAGASPAADVYVGLKTALKISIEARDPKLASQILDDLLLRVEVSREEFESMMLQGFLGKKGTLRTQLSKAVELLPMVERLVNKSIENDDLKAASESYDSTKAVLRTVSDPETVYRWKVLGERVSEGKKRITLVTKQMDTLAGAPDDPAANYAVGWYFCMVKRNWREGLQMLTKVDDEDLRLLAQLELQDNNSTQSVRLGDAWWDYAATKKDETLVFEASLQRARNYYLTAAANLPDGLDRIRANNRLGNIDRMIGKLPSVAGTPYEAL